MKTEKKEGDFDVVAILKVGWDRRRFIIKTVLVFLLLGLFIALFSPKQYTATTTFIPQIEDRSTGTNFGGLASLAGINIGSSSATSEITPTLYPKIVNSINFKRALLDTPITIEEEGIQVTYAQYYEEYHRPGFLAGIKKYTIGLPKVIKGLFSSGGSKTEEALSPTTDTTDIIRLNRTEVKHFSRIENQIEVNYNSKEKTVELRYIMPEPLMSAEMAKASEALLQKEVITFRIHNAQEQLAFTQAQYDEKQEEFLSRQRALANFRDKNQNIASAMARNELQRLEAEYNFAFNLYTEMAKQLEQAKLKVSKDTPIFSVLNPVTVPNSKSAPNRMLIVIGFVVLGVVFAVGVLFVQYFISDLKKAFETKNQMP